MSWYTRGTYCHFLYEIHYFVFYKRLLSKISKFETEKKYNVAADNYLPRSLGLAFFCINPLKPELNPICYLLVLLGAHHFLHVSRIRVKLLTLRQLMFYIYIYIYIYMEHPFLMFLDHTQRRSTVGRTPLDE